MTDDVLIVGSGAAGLTAALNLAETHQVAVIAKGSLSEGATGWAQGGIAAVLEKGDSFEAHVRDTIVAGAGLNDEKVVEHVVGAAPEAIARLIVAEGGSVMLADIQIAKAQAVAGDLGARPRETFRRVIFPLAIPGVVAGSIFTFSLTLGDYIIPGIVGNSRPFIGQAVYQFQGTAGNIPLAAAFTIVPIVVMAIYLVVARRMGAFDAL